MGQTIVKGNAARCGAWAAAVVAGRRPEPPRCLSPLIEKPVSQLEQYPRSWPGPCGDLAQGGATDRLSAPARSDSDLRTQTAIFTFRVGDVLRDPAMAVASIRLRAASFALAAARALMEFD